MALHARMSPPALGLTTLNNLENPLSPNMEQEIGVFAKGTRTNHLPSYKTDRDSAQWMVTTGIARWVNNRRKSVVMIVEMAFAKLRDLSSTMPASVTERAAEGCARARAMVEAWRYTYAA